MQVPLRAKIIVYRYVACGRACSEHHFRQCILRCTLSDIERHDVDDVINVYPVRGYVAFISDNERAPAVSTVVVLKRVDVTAALETERAKSFTLLKDAIPQSPLNRNGVIMTVVSPHSINSAGSV